MSEKKYLVEFEGLSFGRAFDRLNEVFNLNAPIETYDADKLEFVLKGNLSDDELDSVKNIPGVKSIGPANS